MADKLEFYLSFPGTAAKAAKFYTEIFGLEAVSMKFKDFPPEEGMEGFDPELIGHASIPFDNADLMFSDGYQSVAPHGEDFSIAWTTNDEVRYHDVWKKFMAADVKVIDEPAPTFWAQLFGRVTDPFGFTWLLMYVDLNAPQFTIEAPR